MDVLGALLQLGEGGERVAGLGVQRVVDFQEDRAVALHDQRVGGLYCMGSLPGKDEQCEAASLPTKVGLSW